MSEIDKPEDVRTADAAVAELDGEDLARRCNEAMGSSLTATHALTVARLVALAALRQPGRPLTVASIHGIAEEGRVKLSLLAPLASVEIQSGEGV